MVLGTVKLKHRNSTISPSTRRRDVEIELTARKNITKEFTIVFYEIQFIVIRNSKLAGSSKSPSKWMLAQEHHSCCPSSVEFERYRKNLVFLTIAPMRLRSDFRAAVTIKNRLHRESAKERAELFFHQYQRWHPSSRCSWWNWNVQKMLELTSSILFFFGFVAVVFAYS